jgi:hypothetical protein
MASGDKLTKDASSGTTEKVTLVKFIVVATVKSISKVSPRAMVRSIAPGSHVIGHVFAETFKGRNRRLTRQTRKILAFIDHLLV